MNLAQKYAYTVYREESFSKAAKKLFISQPSLSEMVKKLENELGFLIFDRSTIPLRLTPQGMLYMEYLEEAFENERVALQRIQSLSKTTGKELIIGGGGFVSRFVLPRACREFLKTHRDVNVKLDFSDTAPSGSTKDKLENNRVNIALLYNYNPKQMIGVPLADEYSFLAFTRDCPGAEHLAPYAMDINGVIEGKNFTADKRLYQAVSEEMHMITTDFRINRPELESYVNKMPRASCRVANSRHRGVYYDLMLMGLGCIFVTDLIATVERHRSENVLFVPVDNNRTLHAVYKKGRILNEEEQAFLSVLTDVCSQPKSMLI